MLGAGRPRVKVEVRVVRLGAGSTSQARKERLLVGVYAIAPPAPMRSIAVAASGKEGRRAGRRGDGPSRR